MAGLVAGLLFLVCSSLFAGAKSPSAPARDHYAYATLLFEDLQAVPSYELGPKQYQLVIEAFRKSYLTDLGAPHKEESLLTIARLYQQMATSKFGEPSHREQSLEAYQSLLAEFPNTVRRSEVVNSIRGLGGQAPSEPEQATADGGPQDAGAGPGVTTNEALTPVSLGRDAVRSGSMPVNVGRASSRASRWAHVRQVRYWSHPDYTRIIIELDRNVSYKSDRVEGPERVYFDLRGARLDTALKQAVALNVNDPIVQRIRVGQNQRNVSRVVIDLTARAPYSASWLSNPPRLAIELRTKPQPLQLVAESGTPAPEPTPTQPTFERAFQNLSESSIAISTPAAELGAAEQMTAPEETAAPSPDRPDRIRGTVTTGGRSEPAMEGSSEMPPEDLRGEKRDRYFSLEKQLRDLRERKRDLEFRAGNLVNLNQGAALRRQAEELDG